MREEVIRGSLANKHVVGSLLEFLKNTKVGSREGTAKRRRSGDKERIRMGKTG